MSIVAPAPLNLATSVRDHAAALAAEVAVNRTALANAAKEIGR